MAAAYSTSTPTCASPPLITEGAESTRGWQSQGGRPPPVGFGDGLWAGFLEVCRPGIATINIANGNYTADGGHWIRRCSKSCLFCLTRVSLPPHPGSVVSGRFSLA